MVTAIQVLANNASAVTVKVYDINTINQREVLRSLVQLTRKTANTLASDDISFLSDPDYIWNDQCLYARLIRSYGEQVWRSQPNRST
jgi:hypothetical protein